MPCVITISAYSDVENDKPALLSPDEQYEPVIVLPDQLDDSPPPVPQKQNPIRPPPLPLPRRQSLQTQTPEDELQMRHLELEKVTKHQETEQNHEYESISLNTLEKPSEYTMLSSLMTNVLPDDIESLTDLSMDYMANVDPRKAQLWMLLQMQKIVQRIENVYETVNYYTQPLQSQPLPFKKDAGEEKAAMSTFIHPRPPSPPMDDGQEKTGSLSMKSRGKDYVNLSEISKAVSKTKCNRPLPPLPPKTYMDNCETGVTEDSNQCAQLPAKSMGKFQLPHPYSMLKGNQMAAASSQQRQEVVQMYTESVPQQDIIGKWINIRSWLILL